MESTALQNPFFDSIPLNKSLFHYTDAGGLVGLVNGKLWLTSLHYQNDSKEYYYAINMLKDILNTEYPGLLHDTTISMLGRKMSLSFSFSLSEQGDSLSQWRGYCPKGGFALSFENVSFNNFIKDNNLQIVKCVYNVNDQKEVLRKYVIGITQAQFEHARATKDSSELPFSVNTLHYEIFNKISRVAPILKDPNFCQEEEWRLIKTLISTDAHRQYGSNALSEILPSNNVKVRPRGNAFIPYVEIPLKHDESRRNVSVAIVRMSPSNLPDNLRKFAEDACKSLLYTSDKVAHYNAEVVSSIIPYIT
ncbi:DUF2971 domain-containing protein [Hymenobacter sp. PAMC 26628]|uniref:DUF2971 domain-containing protein n=1 Tax=Hymenobacter sp. PAMC 26628 TaxID=1484118 RepID=UPI0009E73A10|nr:DUF2971 domain-containing protein [Hymenobacter sp. PAMC 26628]